MGAFTTVLIGFESPDGAIKGNLILVALITTVAFSDIGGYTFGVLWGKAPAGPQSKPKEILGGLGRLPRFRHSWPLSYWQCSC